MRGVWSPPPPTTLIKTKNQNPLNPNHCPQQHKVSTQKIMNGKLNHVPQKPPRKLAGTLPKLNGGAEFGLKTIFARLLFVYVLSMKMAGLDFRALKRNWLG